MDEETAWQKMGDDLFDAALDMLGERVKVVRLATPLPCGTGGYTCGRAAYGAYAYPATVAGIDQNFPGHWVLLPVCDRCATATAQLYETA